MSVDHSSDANEAHLFGVAGPPHLGVDATEDVATIALNLAREVWILRDRMFLLEQLLVNAKVLEAGALDQQWPDAATSDQLEADRDEFVKSIFRATSIGS